MYLFTQKYNCVLCIIISFWRSRRNNLSNRRGAPGSSLISTSLDPDCAPGLGDRVRRRLTGGFRLLHLLAQANDEFAPGNDVLGAGFDMHGMSLHVLAGALALSREPDVLGDAPCSLDHAVTEARTLRLDARVDRVQDVADMGLHPF